MEFQGMDCVSTWGLPGTVETWPAFREAASPKIAPLKLHPLACSVKVLWVTQCCLRSIAADSGALIVVPVCTPAARVPTE